MIINEYQKLAQGFLDTHGITFECTLVGSDCPQWCEDARKGVDRDKVSTFPRKTHIHGKHYLVTLRKSKAVSMADGKPIYQREKSDPTLVMDFWNSYAAEELLALGCKDYRNGVHNLKFTAKYPKPSVKPYDVLACLVKNDPGTFEEFCSDFGYDTDSRRAEDTFRAVHDQFVKVSRFFTAEEMEELQEIN